MDEKLIQQAIQTIPRQPQEDLPTMSDRDSLHLPLWEPYSLDKIKTTEVSVYELTLADTQDSPADLSDVLWAFERLDNSFYIESGKRDSIIKELSGAVTRKHFTKNNLPEQWTISLTTTSTELS